MEPAWLPADRGELPWMQPEDVGHRLPAVMKASKLLAEIAFAAAALGQHEPCFRGGSINREALDWRLTFDRSIRPYANAHRLEDYWRIREEALGPERAEADRRSFTKRPTSYVLPVPMPWPVAAPAPAPSSRAPESMSVTCALHPLIEEVAAERYNRGAYNDAVRSAFQAVEHRVDTLVGHSSHVGDRLMGVAFNNKPDPPMLTVTRSTGGSLESEQNGMQFLFKGAMGALRNPRSHGPDEKDDRDEAEEMLVFASFLMRRLDIEDDKRNAAATP